ncbi:MAG TPA: sigma-E factor negative regulatory protein [Candidatus Binatia bacterium]|nr:sigma-E factor negative regulatory protein [Candidatus Binatia bacterium]
MTDESLSALLDGECSAEELDRVLAEIERQPALKQRYSRLCLARESRAGTRVRKPDFDFADRVMASLEGRPSGKVLAFPTRWTSRRAQAWRPATGFAAAAAVAAIAVFAVRPDTATLPAPAAAVSPTMASDSEDGQILPASYRPWAQLDTDNARQLNTYFMSYSSARAEHGAVPGLARYAANPAEEVAPRVPERKK